MEDIDEQINPSDIPPLLDEQQGSPPATPEEAPKDRTPVDERWIKDRLGELRTESSAGRRRSSSFGKPTQATYEERAVTSLKEQLLALLSAHEIELRRKEAIIEAAALRQQIIDLGAVPVA